MTVLNRIDELDILSNRQMLNINDNCYYYFTYHRDQSLTSGSPRSIIKNLKRKPSELSENENFSRFKTIEINKIAIMLHESIKERPDLLNFVWIPAAPSKSRTDPEYDDRLVRILSKLNKKLTSLQYIDPFYSIES